MKDLKFLIGSDLNDAYADINQLFHMHKYYLENMVGKQKDQPMEEFIDLQMKTLISFCSSHLERVKENIIKSASEWKNKHKPQEEE